MPLFPLVQLFYWLALATWFGGVLWIVVAAPVIFRTVSESDPTLPTVLSVNLEGQHSTLLGGSIVANLLSLLVRVELICAGVLGLALVGQWAMLGGLQLGLSVLRTCLFIGATAMVLYDWRFVTPRILRYRQEYIDHADDPEKANAAREQFDRYHKESVTVLLILMAILSALVLFSSMISTAQSFQLRSA
jgi:hypothetical protein